MKSIHYIAGLPRSGSTLLCNILNQNPKFYASGTSPLISLMRATMGSWSSSPEVQSQIDAEKSLYFKRFRSALVDLMQGWYKDQEEPVIFDKSRAWGVNWPLINRLYENPKMIICVRDLRDVFASVEKQASASLLYGDALPITLEGRFNHTFTGDGVIGGPLIGLKDLIDRKLIKDSKKVFIWKYEEFCANPTEGMEKLYKFLDEEKFKHNFDNVKRATHEDDSVYKYTYPHRGEGKVRPVQPEAWREYVPEHVAEAIWNRYQWYYKEFYRTI